MRLEWPSLNVSPKRSIPANVVMTALIYLAVIAAGGLWGIGAVYVYFAIEIALRGQLEGAVGGVFFPLFMLPWGLIASRTSLRLLEQWMDVLTPTRRWQASGGQANLTAIPAGTYS